MLSWFAAESAPLTVNARAAEGRADLLERQRRGRVVVDGRADRQVGAEPVLLEVVGHGHAVEELARRVVVAAGIDLVALAERRGRSAERVEEELVPAALQRELARHECLAAVVEVVADAEDLVVEELRGARCRRAGPAHARRCPRPSPRSRPCSATEHAERGGRGAAVGVDVVDVVGDAGGVERLPGSRPGRAALDRGRR